jgi:hypothetical protein
VYNYRSCYVNFAGHLLNAYNPNVLHPGLRYRWSDTDWGRFVDMIADFGYNVFEFWLEPQFFCRAGLESDYGRELGRQMQRVIDQGHRRGVAVKMLAALSTVGLEYPLSERSGRMARSADVVGRVVKAVRRAGRDWYFSGRSGRLFPKRMYSRDVH